MPPDPILAYFSDERLRHYRYLQKRYPRWCRGLPDTITSTRADLGPSWRLRKLIGELRDDLQNFKTRPPVPSADAFAYFDSPVEGSDLPTVHLHDYEVCEETDDVHYTEVELPLTTIHRALLTAIAIVVERPGGIEARGRAPFEDWVDQLRRIIVTNDSSFSTSGRELWRRFVRARNLSTVAARTAINLRTKGKASGARQALQSYWTKIGVDIGLIPSRRGGRADLIPAERVWELAVEARSLVTAVSTCPLTEEERSAARALLLAEPDPMGDKALRDVAAERVKGGQDAASVYRHWDKSVKLDEWCLRLAFPMLTASELVKILNDPGEWRWLPAARLNMTKNKLSKRLSEHRKHIP